jgi:hypothetical protein
MADKKKLSIFLSHAGEDQLIAIDLANKIKSALLGQGYKVDVFNTSEPEHRFKDLKDVLLPGDLWEPKIKRYDTELAAYLQKHLALSFAYLLLVTRNSLIKNSEWIEMEMSVAKEEAERKKLYFIPCVTEGAELSQLPKQAETFLGLDISAEDGIDPLTTILIKTLQNRK